MKSCSIIICSHNRAAMLAETIRSVYTIDCLRRSVELIVVDNRSTDGTAEAVRHCSRHAPFRTRYVREDTPGLACARNRGVSEASGDIVLFLDDDARPATPAWLTNIAEAFSDGRVGAAGGDIVPRWPRGEEPAWIHQRLFYFFGLTTFNSTTSRLCRYPNFPWGANLAFRKDSLKRVGGFPDDLGRVGLKLQSGEETEACLKIQRAGQLVRYVPGAAVEHIIDSGRLSLAWMRSRASSGGDSTAVLEGRHFSGPALLGKVAWRACILAAARLGVAVAGAAARERDKVFFEMEYLVARAYLSRLLQPSARPSAPVARD